MDEGVLTRDGRTLVYREGDAPNRDIFYVLRGAAAEPHPFATTQFDERSPAISPDSRWIAYVSNESGRDEVYARPFPQGDGRWQVSAAGGVEPRWSPNGRELFYRNGDTLIAAQVRTQPSFAAVQRVALFSGRYEGNVSHASYDVHPDGQRFIFVQTGEGSEDLILVQNFLGTGKRAGSRERER